MRIAYFALSVDLASYHGGTTHVTEVCRGLEQLGHEVWVICSAPSSALPPWVKRIELGRRPWIYLTAWRSAQTILWKLGPGAVMERYYNFAGQGVFWASRMGIPRLLEVNAPMAAAPGTVKWLLDRLTLGQLLARAARRQAELASAIVTPLATTVPWTSVKGKVVELPWGANTDLFSPELRHTEESRALQRSLGLKPEDRVTIFHGSFRSWHGIDLMVDVIPLLMGLDPHYKIVLLGEGERLEVVQHRLRPFIDQGKVIVAGRVPYHTVPHYLAISHAAVAPFVPAAHPYLRHFGFYWSPLKVFEAMAAGLPVVTCDVHPLNEVVRHGREGLLFRPGSRAELLAALHRLLSDPELCLTMGERARARVVERYSWQAHCARLNDILQRLVR